MTQFRITSKGCRLLQLGADRAADLLQAASSVAEDGQVSQDELVEKLSISREEAEEVLEGLVQLDLIRPANPLRSTPSGYGRFRQDVRRRGG